MREEITILIKTMRAMLNLDAISSVEQIDILAPPDPPKAIKLKWILLPIFVIFIVATIITIVFTIKIETKERTILNTTTQITTTLKLPLLSIKISANAIWSKNGITIVSGSDQHSNQLNEILYPEGIYVDDDQTIFITDARNNRIIKWKNGATQGEIVAGGNGKGNQINQLDYPTDVILDKETNSLIVCDYGNKRVMRWFRQKVTDGQIIISNIVCSSLAIDNEGYLYVSDQLNHEVRRWNVSNATGIVVAGGNGKGNRLDQLQYPTNIFVDQNQSVYVSDWKNHRVSKWVKDAKQGIIVAGGHSKGNSFEQLSSPRGILVDQSSTVYIADNDNNRIVRWLKGVKEGDVIIGGNGAGNKSNQLYEPVGLSFDQQGNIYVSERDNYRVQRFDIYFNANV